MTIIYLLVLLIFPLFLFNSYAQDPVTVARQLPRTAADAGSFWLWNLSGRFHPLAVHFPVSLILLAAVLELFTLKIFNSKLRAGINILVLAGVVTAVISVILGLLLSRDGDYGDDSLLIHQWTGIGAAFLGSITLLFLYGLQANRNWSSVKVYRGMLFFTTCPGKRGNSKGIGCCLKGDRGAVSVEHIQDLFWAVLLLPEFQIIY